MVELRADEMFGCLERHGVRYVLIGGLAGILHGTVLHPAGTGGFEDLIARAQAMKVKDWTVPVAALEDVIRSKEAAARPKDQRALPVLRQLLEEIRARRESG